MGELYSLDHRGRGCQVLELQQRERRAAMVSVVERNGSALLWFLCRMAVLQNVCEFRLQHAWVRPPGARPTGISAVGGSVEVGRQRVTSRFPFGVLQWLAMDSAVSPVIQ